MASKMTVAKPTIRKFTLFHCFLPCRSKLFLPRTCIGIHRKGLRGIGRTVAMVTTILLSLSLKRVENFVKLDGARASTGLCVDVSSGVMI